MWKLLVIAVLLAAACGDDADPHELGHCDSAWGNVTSCEAACEARPTMETGFGTCRVGTNPGTGQPEYCPKANERDGGCCTIVHDDVRLFECL